MMKRYPHPGGLYAYVTDVYGHDRGFLIAWFLFLTYASVFWANATSIPLFARNFMFSCFSLSLISFFCSILIKFYVYKVYSFSLFETFGLFPILYLHNGHVFIVQFLTSESS